jgi:hypothetical protein
MSTFTNVLQQRINALENQIRNLQEQNNNLRRRARYLLPAPKPNLQLLRATDILPGQQGWMPRTPTMDEISDIINDMWSNGTINPGQP